MDFLGAGTLNILSEDEEEESEELPKAKESSLKRSPKKRKREIEEDEPVSSLPPAQLPRSEVESVGDLHQKSASNLRVLS
jgi:hypothetical protein